MTAQKQFKEILNDFSDAMLATRTADNYLHARPMHIVETDAEGGVWFVTDRHSAKVMEIENRPQVLVTMQGGGKYLSLTGQASFSENRAKIDELWSEAWKIWFPDGKDDPDIMLLHVEPRIGEYWDNSGTDRFRYLYEAGKAYFQGVALDATDLDNNAKVTW